MLNTLKKQVRHLRRWKKYVWDDREDFSVSFPEKLRWALKGFSVNESVWYKLKENGTGEYISEFERLDTRQINGSYRLLLDDKLVFEELFSKYTRVPVNYAWISDGEIYPLHGAAISEENLLPFLKDVKKSVLKWTGSGGGSDTYVFDASGEDILVNGQAADEEAVRKLFGRKGEALLCEYITQSAFSAALYPHATNTIRLVCAKKKGEKRAHFISAIQRIGSDDSIPVDNASAGGMTASIDPETGRLGPAIAKLGRMERRMMPFSYHPDTGGQIEGAVIPGWTKLKEEMETLTNALPYLKLVAWDILLTDAGYAVIEGNASTGFGIFQVEHGVRHKALGDLIRSYGIIK